MQVNLGEKKGGSEQTFEKQSNLQIDNRVKPPALNLLQDLSRRELFRTSGLDAVSTAGWAWGLWVLSGFLLS